MHLARKMLSRSSTRAGVLASLLLGLFGLAAAPAAATQTAPATQTTAATPQSANAEATPAQSGPQGYSASLADLNESARAFESDPQNHYTYCIRTIGRYECLSYGANGEINKAHLTSEAHGTGVAYQQVNGETYLLTNQHVADWPPVTDATHTATDVPAGCKLIGTSLKIVDNESDDYVADDIPLTEVVSDVALDAAILKARGLLRTMPYPIGKSAQLRVGDAVVVKGFPLGVFRAITTGQVINTFDHDDAGDWDHDDFIIDAPLSEGNSGSPVLAISRRTGQYEFVGLFHARYVEGEGLNAVIAIEQLRNLMTTLKRSPPNAWAGKGAAAEQRAGFLKTLDQSSTVPFLQLGNRLVELKHQGDQLIYEIYATDFPKQGWRELLIVDSPALGSFGAPSTLWLARGAEFVPVHFSTLDASLQASVMPLVRRLHELSMSTFELRRLRGQADASREALLQFEQFKRQMDKAASDDAALAQSVEDMHTNLDSHASGAPLSLDALLAQLALPPPPATAKPTAPGATSSVAAPRQEAQRPALH